MAHSTDESSFGAEDLKVAEEQIALLQAMQEDIKALANLLCIEKASLGVRDQYEGLTERIRSRFAALDVTTDPDARAALIQEIGAGTKELTRLVLHETGRLGGGSNLQH